MNYRCETDLSAIKDYLQNAPVVAFDFETAPLLQYRDDPRAALDAHRACIVGISLSVAEGSAIYIPLEHFDGGNADSDQVISFLRDALWTNPAVTKVAHNLAFESMFLYALGIIIQPPCYDTIAAAQMTLKNSFEFRALSDSGLKKLVPELLGDELPTFEDVTGGKFFDELNSHDPETVRYACADSDYALRLYRRFNEWFDAFLSRHRWIVENVESPTAVYCGLMKYNGLLMDEPAMIRKQGECAARLLELREQRRDLTFESAAVIDRESTNWTSALTLNRGTAHGVEKNDCVVSAEGDLVGVVSAVGYNWCTVLTVIDTDTELGARVFRTQEVAVAEGDLALMGEGKLKLSYLSADAQLLSGDVVTTSGLGGFYPGGLVIGTVESVRTGDDGLAQYAVLAPAARLGELSEVFIIKDFDIVD